MKHVGRVCFVSVYLFTTRCPSSCTSCLKKNTSNLCNSCVCIELSSNGGTPKSSKVRPFYYWNLWFWGSSSLRTTINHYMYIYILHIYIYIILLYIYRYVLYIYIYVLYIYINLIGGLEHFLFFHIIGNVIIPTDVHSYFSEGFGFKPPTINGLV